MDAHTELRLVTCLFIDVVGSTAATVELGPERMRRLLGDAFAQLSGTIRGHGGVVEKYIGDAILGTFGIPVSHPDDAARALRAAHAAATWARGWAASGGLSIRAGLETGELLVDPEALDTNQRMVIGESINLAARLQSYAEPGDIIVGPRCHEATADGATFEPVPGVELKGFGPVDAWRLLAFRDDVRAEFEVVGRDAELAAIAEAFARARDGERRLVLITGPAGQGKSKLAVEAVRRASGFRRLDVRCRQEPGQNSPLRQLLEAETGEATADAIGARITATIASSDGGAMAAAICHSAGVAVDEGMAAISRYEQRELIARAWERYLVAVARDGPTCLLVEDLHWGDPVLLRVIDQVTFGRDAPILAVCTARPEFVPSDHFRPRDGRTEIALPPLDDAAAARLAEIAGGSGARLSGTVQRAAGNPLFLIELARVPSAGTRLPVTVQAAIAARLDELEPQDRALLQRTSVAGESFGVRDATVLADRDAGDVVAALLRAAHMGFVVPTGTQYRFHHALVRDVVYGQLPMTERMALHARYATDGLDETDLVGRAHHWWEALKPPDAAWVWSDPERHAAMRREAFATHLAAGLRLEERNGYEEALEVYERAVHLAETTTERALAEAEVGRLFARQGKGDEAWARRKVALELYAEAGEQPPAAVYADMLELTTFNWGYFQHLPTDEDVLRLLEDGERIARATNDDVSLARLLAERASYTEDMAGAAEFERLLAGADDPVPLADAAQRMATVYSWAGRIDDAIALFARVFDDLIPAGAHTNSPEALAWFARAAFDAGDLASASRLAALLDGESLHRSAHTRSHFFGVEGLIAFGRGDAEALRRAADELRALATEHPDVPFCLVSGACIGYEAATEALAGRVAPDLDIQVRRQVGDSEPIFDATVLLAKVMAGDPGALDRGLVGYQPGARLRDRYRVWDDASVIPAIALTMLERWDELAAVVARLDELDTHGARLAGAIAEAIREETRAAADGPHPRHERLEALGYAGISALLRFRPASR